MGSVPHLHADETSRCHINYHEILIRQKETSSKTEMQDPCITMTE